VREWAHAGVAEELHALVPRHHDHMIGIALDDVVVDGCITRVPIRVEIVRVGLILIKDAEIDEIPVPARPPGSV
jgi:hypothetical protein